MGPSECWGSNVSHTQVLTQRMTADLQPTTRTSFTGAHSGAFGAHSNSLYPTCVRCAPLSHHLCRACSNPESVAGTCRWHPTFVFKTWFIDAFTIHPRKLNDLVRGIWLKGKRQPVQTSSITISDSDLPSVMVYIAVHHLYGVRVFFPATACRGGNHEGKPCHPQHPQLSTCDWHMSRTCELLLAIVAVWTW